MTAPHRPPSSPFQVADHRHRFDSARDAIDAVSAFEASTLDDWEYEVRAMDDEPLAYLAAVKSLGRISDRYVSGYLEPAQ